MMVQITPSVARGRVTAPPSKSMAHRALLCGALSTGSTVRGLSYSEDIRATLSCLQALGATIEQMRDTVRLGGLTPSAIPPNALLPCNESGSTLRFLLPLCMLADVPVTLTGSRRLFQRPLTVYEDIARRQGIAWEQTDHSVTVCGRLTAGTYRVPGDISSQFITGLLLALPLLQADSRLEVVGAFESASYVGLTLSVLSAFGVSVERQGQTYLIPGCRRPGAADYTVEGDCSNAAFLEAFNLLGGDVKVDGLSAETQQGDRVYRDFYRGLEAGERRFDLSDCPDLGPVMMALAAANGGAVFTGTARLKIKESDRAACMAEELSKFGIAVTVEENTVTVHPGLLQPPTAVLDGHNDHRIVMALSLLSSRVGGRIDGAQAVAKSYPNYFEVLQALQIGVSEV